jgi:recombinational DNA repair protein RecR
MDERPDSSQQLMDILLVMDEKGTLQAVSGVKDGELQTKNPLEDNNDLLRVDRHGDMFSNFFSNLWNQLKDPTRFHFFRVPEEEVQRVAAGGINEVILALSTTMEGDTTNFYIYRKLEKLGVKLSVIARGISIGDELEYTDEVTLGRSIVNRTPFSGTA